MTKASTAAHRNPIRLRLRGAAGVDVDVGRQDEDQPKIMADGYLDSGGARISFRHGRRMRLDSNVQDAVFTSGTTAV